MKKIISTVAALGLVVGVAGTASAMDFSMSGQYIVEGYMLNNADGGDNSATTGGFDPYNDESGTDSAWLHTFIVKPKLQVNDKIAMFSELRFARYSVWGDQDDVAGEQNIDVYTLYMEYLSPVGKFRMGRCMVPPWGGEFLSTYTHADRLMWGIAGYPDELCQKISASIHQRSEPPCCIPGQVTHMVNTKKADTDGVRIMRVVWLPIQGKGADVGTAPFKDIELTVVISDAGQLRVKRLEHISSSP